MSTTAQIVLEALKAGRFDENARNALRSLTPADRSSQLEKALIRTLDMTDDPRVRNAAANASSDIRSTEALEQVRKLLQSPKTVGARSTLLYALKEAKTALSLDELIDLLVSDDLEACEEALSFLEDKLVEPFGHSDLARAIERLKAASAQEKSGDKRDLLADAIETLSASG